MSNLINQIDVLKAYNNLMGRRTLPGGVTEDMKNYCQNAFNYAWRYYKWKFSLRRATIDLVSSPYMPDDFDIDGYMEVANAYDQPWTFVPIDKYDSYGQTGRYFTLEYDATLNKYKFVTAFTAPTVNVIYQTTPPTLTENTSVPFPSAMTVALGAVIWGKRGENPRSADVTRDWDQFHAELDRHVARSYNGAGSSNRGTRQDVAGTYTGDVGDL